MVSGSGTEDNGNPSPVKTRPPVNLSTIQKYHLVHDTKRDILVYAQTMTLNTQHIPKKQVHNENT